MQPRKVLIVSNDDWSIYNFRMPLIRALSRKGLDIVLVFPRGKYTDIINASGYRTVNWDLDKGSLNPFSELKAILQLLKIYRKEKPFLAHHYSIKSNIYGLICKRISRVEHIMITWAGLGFVFSNSLNARLLRLFLVPFMRRVLRSREEWNIFLNPEDRELFLQLGLASPENSVVILGEGVDTEKFSPEETKETPPVVLLASRLLWDKGVGDFVEAAKVLREEGVPAVFWIAGEQDRGNPSRIPDNVIDEWRRDNIVRFLGHVDDMAGLLKKASLAVLPSYYMEGTPRFLLEAASAGLPIVATDIAGCRVVVKDGRNGFLVPIKQPKVLAVKIKEIIENKDARSRMGKVSREIVLSQLDERIIVGEFVKLYDKFC